MASTLQVKQRTASEKLEPASGALLVLVIVPLALGVLFWWPRAAPPVELPALALPLGDVRAALALEDELASREPATDEEAARRVPYLEQGLAEVRGGEPPGAARDRLNRLSRAYTRLLEVAGPEGVAAARAADVVRMEQALREEGEPEARARELGVFGLTLERWHAVEGGVRIAPRIVIRALAAARWNALHDRELTEGLSPLHLRAYHGWLGLHGAIGWSEMRERALGAYASAGGHYAREARGTLLYLEGETALAATELMAAYELTSNLRVRNAALAAVSVEP